METAALLGKNRTTVFQWVKAGKLPSTPLGNVVLIRKEDVDRMLVAKTKRRRHGKAGQKVRGEE